MIEAKSTILITGASSSLAIPTIHHPLTHYPLAANPNTQQLLKTLSPIPQTRYSIFNLDLSSFSSISNFALNTKAEILSGKLDPLAAVICNASTWGISSGLKLTSDGHESCIAINHLAHFSLALRLLDAFGSERGKNYDIEQ